MPRHPSSPIAAVLAKLVGPSGALIVALGAGGCGHQAAGATATGTTPALDNPRAPPRCHCKRPCPAHVEGGPCACPSHGDADHPAPVPAP